MSFGKAFYDSIDYHLEIEQLLWINFLLSSWMFKSDQIVAFWHEFYIFGLKWKQFG
jgi:hypothetical protein